MLATNQLSTKAIINSYPKNSNKVIKKRKDKQKFISTINITHISQKHQWTSQKKYPTTIGYWSLKRKKGQIHIPSTTERVSLKKPKK
jgi:hypothetical protein